mgnify:CR=1 FL=1
MDGFLILNKEVDQSVLKEGFSIPNQFHELFFQQLGFTLAHGESRLINLLLDNATDPVVWRGPVIAGAVKQFWTETIWGDVDFMFVDMPPGTGDVPLTVYQPLPVDGIVIVTSPQELVSMIVSKAANMAKMMNLPIVVEGVETKESLKTFRCA